MALTQSQELAQKMQLLRSHGITRDLHLLEGKKVGAWHYEQQILGFNYRMTDIQAALGLSQLQHLEDWLARRRQLATQYDTWFSELPIITPSLVSEVKSAWHLYVIQIKSATLDMTRKEVFSALRAEGIGVNVHYMPVYLQPYYQKLGFAQGLCPVAEDYYHHAISIPMYAGLTDEQQAEVIEVLTGILA
jgi:dTDP-4-amino-4,6-dideoxygalactose transaminase